MRAIFLALGLMALAACNRDAAPQPQQDAPPKSEKAEAAPTPPAAASPQAPVADDTSRDAASHAARTAIPVILTLTQGAGELKNGARVEARFAASQSTCRLALDQPIAAGQGGEARLTCDTPLHLRGGAFEFSLHAGNGHVADGVVLQ